MSEFSEYAAMRASGMDAGSAYRAAKRAGMSDIDAIRMLRLVFGVSLVEVKEVLLAATGSTDTLENHQEKLVDAVEQVLDAMRDDEARALSDAIVLFLIVPSRRLDRLVAKFGTERGRLLADRINELSNEIANVELDWSAHTLSSGTAFARGVMQQRHPKLSAAALDALASSFSFDWR